MTAILRHRSATSDPAARGLALGRALTDAVRHTTTFYRRVFESDAGLTPAEIDAAGARVGERLAAVEPGMLAEIEAIAQGAGCAPLLLLAVNARTELIAGSQMAGFVPNECTAAALLPQATDDGSCLLAQNWDFHPGTARSRLIWRVPLPDGRWLATFTEAGILAKAGLNGDGVGCVLTFLSSDRDGGVEGMPIHLLIRAVLERATDLAGARALLERAGTAASSCITVGHAGPDGAGVASVELSPGNAGTVGPDAHGRLVHTNHFLAGLPATDLVLQGPHAASTLSRYDAMRRLLERPALARGELASFLGSQEGGLCSVEDPSAPWPLRYATLASLVLDLTRRQLWLSDPLGDGVWERVV